MPISIMEVIEPKPLLSLFISQLTKHIELTTEEQVILLSYCTLEKIDKKAILIQESMCVKAVYYLLNGCLCNYFHDESGYKHILHFIQEGGWVTDFKSFYKDQPSQTILQALEDCCVVKLKKKDFNSLFEKVPKLERFFLKIISNALVASTEFVMWYRSKNAEERYLEFISKYPGIELRIPQYMIASYLGITPVFLSKIRSALK